MRYLIWLMLLVLLLGFSSAGRTEDYQLSWLLIGIIVVLILILMIREWGRPGGLKLHLPFARRRLRMELVPDRRYRPQTLTLVIQNVSRRDIDIEAPVIRFRKLFLIRNFKLKGVDRNVLYPLYLESGKVHELPVSVRVFHDYDSSLRKYYWARVLVKDTNGRTYRTAYVTLRKSLFS